MRLLPMIGAAAVFVVLAAGVALAGPNCEKNPDHWRCQEPPGPPTTPTPEPTTTPPPPATAPPVLLTCEERIPGSPALTNGFRVTGIECVDWTTTSAGLWLVTVEDSGGASHIDVQVKNADIGDFCWVGHFGKKEVRLGKPKLTISLPGGEPLPASTVGACGPEDDAADSFVFRVGTRGTSLPVTVKVEPLL